MNRSLHPFRIDLSQGVFRSRRVRDLSDPLLVAGLIAVTVLGILAGLVFYIQMSLSEIRRGDTDALADAAQISALRVERLLDDADNALADMADMIAAAKLDTATQDDIRTLRRELFDVLGDSPLAGIIAVDADNQPLLEVGSSDGASLPIQIALPLAHDAEFLADRLGANVSGDFSRVALDGSGRDPASVQLRAYLDRSRLEAHLAAPASKGRKAAMVLLLDTDGRVVASSNPKASPVRAWGLQLPYNAEPLAETDLRNLTTGPTAGNTTPSAHVALASRPLSISAIGRQVTLARALSRLQASSLAFLSTAVLAIVLLVSLIQNEWRKHDRRLHSNADIVARAEIASNLIEGGVIDWLVEDGQLTCSHGWRRLFGYSDESRREDIQDWTNRIHPQDRARALDLYQDLMDRAGTIDHELRIQHADGSYVPVRERGATRLDANGGIARIILVQTSQLRANDKATQAA